MRSVGRAHVHLLSSPVFGGVANGVGVVDQMDLNLFDTVMAQGFVSRAAEEVGDMDDADRVILVGEVSFGKASSTIFNGTVSNCPRALHLGHRADHRRDLDHLRRGLRRPAHPDHHRRRHQEAQPAAGHPVE